MIRNSVLLGTLFNEPQFIEASFATGNYSIGENCFLEKVILDEYASIGSNVQLTNKNNLQKFDGDGIFIRDGIIIVTSGARVPDGFIL